MVIIIKIFWHHLVKMEADYDKQMKESLTEDSISVRWDTSLSGKKVAIFSLRTEASRIMVGDELRLKLGEGAMFLHKPWEGVGYCKAIVDGEVQLELKVHCRGSGKCDGKFCSRIHLEIDIV